MNDCVQFFFRYIRYYYVAIGIIVVFFYLFKDFFKNIIIIVVVIVQDKDTKRSIYRKRKTCLLDKQPKRKLKKIK